MLTARWRISGAKLFVVLTITGPFSQGLGPSDNPEAVQSCPERQLLKKGAFSLTAPGGGTKSHALLRVEIEIRALLSCLMKGSEQIVNYKKTAILF